jgi:hypothetical protein
MYVIQLLTLAANVTPSTELHCKLQIANPSQSLAMLWHFTPSHLHEIQVFVFVLHPTWVQFHSISTLHPEWLARPNGNVWLQD